MKIVEHGKRKEEDKNACRFDCAKCGCVFIAQDSEYYEPPKTINSVSASIVYANCPECHYMCSAYKNAPSLYFEMTANGCSDGATMLMDKASSEDSNEYCE